MYNPCYNLSIEITENYKSRVQEIFLLEEKNARSDRAPEIHRKHYPEIFEPLGELADWFSPVVRVLSHKPSKLGTTKIHLDVNEHNQYDQDRYVIVQGALNIPLFESKGVKTKWWRQNNPDNIHPYDFWYDKDFEMTCIYEHEITKPCLFRTGIWHSVEQTPNDDVRAMLSFSTLYTVDWDTIVSVASSNGLLLQQ
jgi:hypothetical protein|tara:strand:- start:234 stop:821 length:588 start_codon:yes stop_codon:yes gene_type:complete